MYKFLAKEKMYAIKALRNASITVVCRRYKINASTLYRWRVRYDGTLDSLESQFSRKGMHHPAEQTDAEKKHITDLIHRNSDIGLNELYGKLRRGYGYVRNPVTLYRYLRRTGFYACHKKRKPYVPKHYDTPEHLGEKWQLDVKYVPRNCYAVKDDYKQFYQYTVIDEASRQRFLYAYDVQDQHSTVDFMIRAFRYFGYIPKQVQTDNGQEFRLLRGETKDGRKNIFDQMCMQIGIDHKCIKPRTPRHNGKVERSHRNDNERFYRWLKFYSFDDLQKQMSTYLRRSNDIPSTALHWQTPLERRAELWETDCSNLRLFRK